MLVKSQVDRKEALDTELEAMAEQFRSTGFPDQAIARQEEFRKASVHYDGLVDELNALEQEARFDPIERLPEEVWLVVLKEALTTQSHGYSFLSTEMVLLLTCVSLSDIIVHDETEDLSMKVAISLSLSRDVPLSLQIVGAMRCWPEIESGVVPHRERIQNIHLVIDPNGDYIRSHLLTISSKLSTPQLRGIYWDWSQKPDDEGLETIFSMDRSRYIRSVSPLNIHLRVMRLPTICNLRDLATNEDADRVLELSEAMPHLRDVSIQQSYSRLYRLGLSQSAGFEAEFRKGHRNATPLYWTSLTYEQTSIATLTTLCHRLPYLLSFKLLVQHKYLSQALTSMQELRNLQHLDIHLRFLSSRDFVLPVVTEPMEKLRKLTVRVQTTTSAEYGSKLLSDLPKTFFSLMPNVETLEVVSYHPQMTYQLTSMMGFRKARTFVLDVKRGSSEVSPPEEHCFPSTVREVIFKQGMHGLLQGMSKIGVEHLQIIPGRLVESLQKLHVSHLRGMPPGWPSFINLTTLVIDGYSQGRESEDATKMCVIISTASDTFPALNTLSFGRFPELDLLFIMLERRNLAFRSTYSRIRSLTLPMRGISSIFKPIRDLLRGRVVNRQSNFEASMQGNIEMLLDHNVPGCLLCHRAQIFCDAATHSLSRTRRTLADMSTRSDPDTVDEVLRTWNERSVTVLVMEVRKLTCEGYGTLRQITADSLECKRVQVYLLQLTPDVAECSIQDLWRWLPRPPPASLANDLMRQLV